MNPKRRRAGVQAKLMNIEHYLRGLHCDDRFEFNCKSHEQQQATQVQESVVFKIYMNLAKLDTIQRTGELLFLQLYLTFFLFSFFTFSIV